MIQTCLLLTLFKICKGSLNLYCSTQEISTLLGLHRELYYISDGTINKNALNFEIPVDKSLDFIHFNWNSKTTHKYQLEVSFDVKNALKDISINISNYGVVPFLSTSWKVKLQCSGEVNGEIPIRITVLIDGLVQKNITIKRRKNCFGVKEDSKIFSSFSNPYYSLLRMTSIYFALVIGLLTLIFLFHHQCQRRQMKNKKMSKSNNDNKEDETLPSNHRLLNPESDGVLGSDAESRVTDWVNKQSRPSLPTPEDILSRLHIDRLNLKLGTLVLEGTFGKIYAGTLLIDFEERDVFVKTVVAGSSFTQISRLTTEGTLLFDAHENRNILAPLASTTDGTSPMIVYPYTHGGNLKKWLNSGFGILSTHQIVHLGTQILSALSYIHKQKLIHKDVACRNCFLDDGLRVRLCDSALSRDLFPSDYHCLGDNENRPIKWMPIEAIASKKYSRASDVWSFGVFLWECTTKASMPFPDIDPFEMETILCEGVRLHQPLNCPDQLYSIMNLCWFLRAAERATVHSLHNNMHIFQQQLQRFV